MTTHKDILGGLHTGEVFWRDRYDWLREHGYTLRTRYKPDWVPSWKATGDIYLGFEDGMGQMVPQQPASIRDSADLRMCRLIKFSMLSASPMERSSS